MWARKCQECGHVQKANEPKETPTAVYTNAKCRRCKSEALDYGHDGYTINNEGKVVRVYDEDEEEE